MVLAAQHATDAGVGWWMLAIKALAFNIGGTKLDWHSGLQSVAGSACDLVVSGFAGRAESLAT
jgi:hypothetical protein